MWISSSPGPRGESVKESSSSSIKKRRVEGESSSVLAKEARVDEARCEALIALEIDYLMGRTSRPPALALLRNEWRATGNSPNASSTPLAPSSTTKPSLPPPPHDAAIAAPARSALRLSEVAEGVVGSVEELATVVRLLRACDFVTVDCEWAEDTLCLVQIASPDSRVFFFDPLTFPGGIAVLFASEGESLRVLLEDSKVVKVAHDGRQDSRILFQGAQTTLTPLFDTQLAYALWTRQQRHRTPLPTALNTVLRDFGGGQVNAHKETAHAMMDADAALWRRRPLDATLLAYAAADVSALPRAYRNMKAALSAVTAARVFELSQRYAPLLRHATSADLELREATMPLVRGRKLPLYHLAELDEDVLRAMPM